MVVIFAGVSVISSFSEMDVRDPVTSLAVQVLRCRGGQTVIFDAFMLQIVALFALVHFRSMSNGIRVVVFV